MAKIVAKEVNVRFPIYSGAQRSLRSALGARRVGGVFDRANGLVVVHALRNLSLSLSDGDRLGIVGHNGAGKTTLLRLLAGVYEPSDGQIERQGSVSALTDLLMGMDTELSGYQNIIMRGIFLGLTRREAESLIPDVEAFTELGKFLEMPVRTYSTGMQVRLAFAVSTAVQSDILIMDEMIGAGDAAFLEKARQRTEAYVGRARIMVLAAHGLETIRSFCNRAIWLEKGEIVAEGPVDNVVERYKTAMAA